MHSMWDSLKSIIKMKHLVRLVLVLFSWLGLFCLFCLWFCFSLPKETKSSS